MELNKYSKTLTQDITQPAAQAMLYGIGLTDEDLKKAQVGVCSMGYDGNTCNMHLNDLAKLVKQGIWDTELVGLIFNTIGVSDGMSNGTDGMRYSLVSRDIIADSIEAVCGAQYYDGLIALPGCDKNMPGSLIAMGRLNRPSIMVYGGTIAPGHYKGQDLNIVSAFEALGQKIAGNLNDADFKGIIMNSCPGAGACGGMYTANTMAAAIEALGMSLPYSSSNPALSEEKKKECLAAGAAIRILLEKDIKPKDIMTREAFENAITVIMILGGSTNAVLHLIAMARSVDVPLTQDDFQAISDRVSTSLYPFPSAMRAVGHTASMRPGSSPSQFHQRRHPARCALRAERQHPRSRDLRLARVHSTQLGRHGSSDDRYSWAAQRQCRLSQHQARPERKFPVGCAAHLPA